MKYLLLFILLSGGVYAISADTTTYSVDVAVLDIGGAAGYTQNYSFAQNSEIIPYIAQEPTSPPTIPTNPSSPGGGRSGTTHATIPASAGIPPSQSGASATAKMLFTDIKQGQIITMSINDPDISLRLIEVEMKDDINGICSLMVSALQEIPSSITTRPPIVYKYLEIVKNNIQNADINNIRITFSVERRWLEQNQLMEDDVVLHHYSDTWEELPTMKLESGIDAVTYRAACSSFSIFAVAAKKRITPITNTQEPQSPSSVEAVNTENAKINYEEPKMADKPVDEIQNIPEKSSAWIYALVLICTSLIIGAVFAEYKIVRKRNIQILHLQMEIFGDKQNGVTDYEIKQRLLSAGLPEQVIDKALARQLSSATILPQNTLDNDGRADVMNKDGLNQQDSHNAHHEEISLGEYVMRQKKKGYDESAIRQKLISAGWPENKIDAMLKIKP